MFKLGMPGDIGQVSKPNRQSVNLTELVLLEGHYETEMKHSGSAILPHGHETCPWGHIS